MVKRYTLFQKETPKATLTIELKPQEEERKEEKKKENR